MKVSIVTVVFNSVSVIEETILSVIYQKNASLEYIVIDGNSTDGTQNIISKYIHHINVFISEPDKGIFDAMNKSLKYVTGEYVIFLNAGDKFVNNHVLSDVFQNYNFDDELIYGDTYFENELGFILQKSNAIYVHNPTKKDLIFKSQGFCHQSLFTKASRLKEILFNLDYPIGADYDTTARIYFTGNRKIRYVKQAISVFDDRFGGASHNKIGVVLDERYIMFDYKNRYDFLLRKYLYIYKLYIKNILHYLFPNMVKKYRQRKYINRDIQ